MDASSQLPPPLDTDESAPARRWQFPLWLLFVAITIVAVGLGVWQALDDALVEQVKPTARAVGTGLLVGIVGCVLLGDLATTPGAAAGIAVAMIFALAGGAVLFLDEFLLYVVGLVSGAIIPAAINPVLIFIQEQYRGLAREKKKKEPDAVDAPLDAESSADKSNGGSTSSPPAVP